MAYREIVTIEDEDILRKSCRPVTDFNDRLWRLLDDMHVTLKKADGVGLAAPQVGIIRRICIVDTGNLTVELINPQMIEHSEEYEVGLEGCLSIPGRHENVSRPSWVRVRAFDRHGKEIEVRAEGFDARAVCHEMDHLDGVLYIDKIVKE